ncbi:MAG: DUF4097 family beta strand repeat protein [Gemmatimonadetes bacterium]|nr:DUF4097 family beta strand repeat protein [Gemmatimonadota bacterium]
MAHSGFEASRLHRIWLGWRKEIIRGVVLFAIVVGVGIAVTRMFGVLPFHLGEHVSRAGLDFGDLDLDNRAWVESFRWTGKVAPDQWVWIRNLNGPVSVEPAAGDSLVVTAEKSWRRSGPDVVEIVAVPHGGTVTVCALWPAEQRTCGENGSYSLKGVRKNDVAVRFTVSLPRGVKIDVSTVNGRLEVTGATAPVTLATVNGRIEAITTQGPIKATTVNGSIDVTMGALAPVGDVELKTVNGSITAALPPNLNADLDAQTVSGRVNTDFPLQVVGRISSRHVQAKIGSGGRQLNLRTVNGSIDIQEAGGATPALPQPPAPVAPPR